MRDVTKNDTWWVDSGLPNGSEAGFRSPVLIVQDDAFNESRIKTIIVLPLTSKLRLLDAHGNVLVNKKESRLAEDSVIIVAQLYALDRQKFIGKNRKESINKNVKQKLLRTTGLYMQNA
jgi:mRNA interferase MazF